jgi:hypothetical protein
LNRKQKIDKTFFSLSLSLSIVDMPDLQTGVYPIGTESLSQDESESIFENKTGLAEDLKFLASMPELCDITFLVGETREPVCAVKVSEKRKIT